MIKNDQQGFTLLEMLVSFLGYCLCLIVAIECIKICLIFVYSSSLTALDIAILQLKWNLSTANYIYLESSTLCYQINRKNFCFSNQNDRLIKSPGHEIYLSNIKDVVFEFNQNFYISGYYQNKYFKYPLTRNYDND